MARISRQIFVSAMGPPGGGRNDISDRFTRHMNIISIDSFDDNTMNKIFTSIVDWHFEKGFDSSFQRLGKVRFLLPPSLPPSLPPIPVPSSVRHFFLLPSLTPFPSVLPSFIPSSFPLSLPFFRPSLIPSSFPPVFPSLLPRSGFSLLRLHNR